MSESPVRLKSASSRNSFASDAVSSETVYFIWFLKYPHFTPTHFQICYRHLWTYLETLYIPRWASKKAFKMLCSKLQEPRKVPCNWVFIMDMNNFHSLSRETHSASNWCKLESKLQKVKEHYFGRSRGIAWNQETLGNIIRRLRGPREQCAAAKSWLSHKAWSPRPCHRWHARSLRSHPGYWLSWIRPYWSRARGSTVEGVGLPSALERGQHPREAK